ncbi:heavy-metal-associated domain-containing protein [Nonomuraea sp. SMC257]|uniref:Heavy-metal-associated domain-containing protein n=1 Tax=Nonomuraea montanisoli TaxID=2741721 RepID=A0A7Y6I2G7_9ACTN|nr:heavy metal-associated domain-containing protein [Nonomuraea montanisoli]NUW29918.1 heavy-metal-associated domain-containing protein [Nonomuraea montanisoli]
MITVAYSLVTYQVAGLAPDACDHCVSGIKAELIRLPGVVGVDVTPSAAKVSVLTDGPVEAEAIRAALEAAGCPGVEG